MILVLVDVERRLKLPTSMSVHHRTAMHRNREATLTVHETNDPVGIEHKTRNGSFLLIVRTGWIFTFHVDTLETGYDKDEYHRILGCSSI